MANDATVCCYLGVEIGLCSRMYTIVSGMQRLSWFSLMEREGADYYCWLLLCWTMLEELESDRE